MSCNVYLKCLRSAKVKSEDVFLKDICSLRCADIFVSAKLNSIKVHHFRKEDERRQVISVLRLLELMEERCPDITVEVIGETDVLIERETGEAPAWKTFLKTAAICLISFAGTAFTIMAYHNDIGINDIFSEMYRILLDREPDGMNAMEVAYSVGLAAGMLIFFNHACGRTITQDPTPIQVAMRNYEKDVDASLAEMAQREHMEEENRI